jgi:hypothetical protein
MQHLFEHRIALHPFRWYQEPALPMFRAAVKEGHKKIVGQAPCGYGKTVVAAHLAVNSMRKGNKVLFACPRISLVDQTLQSFEDQGIRDIGILQANHKRTDPTCQLQIACFDTLYSRPELDFGFVILDEIHLADARMWKLMEKWNIVLALTATPWKKGLGLHFSKLIVLSTINDMLEYHKKDPLVGLVPITGIGPKPEILKGIEELKTGQDGDIQESAAGHFMEKHEVVSDIVDTWLRTRQEGHHPGDRTFVFARRRVTAVAYQEAFRAQGIEFDYIDAFTSNRSPIFKRYRSLQSKGIVSVGCLSTGVDEDVRCMVSAAPRKNQADIVQELGRGARPADGKEYCWLNDHVGNANRYGWFADIFHETLDTTPPHVKGSAYEKDEAAPQEVKRKQCHVCREFLPRGAFKCGTCGTAIVVDDTVTLDGQLVDLRREAVKKKAAKERAKKEKAELAERRNYYGWMLHIGRDKGFKQAWADHRFLEKFGKWPTGLKAIARKPPAEVVEVERERWRQYRAMNQSKPKPEPYQGEY